MALVLVIAADCRMGAGHRAKVGSSGADRLDAGFLVIGDDRKTWDAFYDFFKGVQKKLREQRMRNVYGLRFQVTTNGGDPSAFFDQWLIAYGGQNIVSKDG
jgi:hypothetical protein